MSFRMTIAAVATIVALATAPMMTPRLPFSPPVLNEKLESAVHGFIDG